MGKKASSWAALALCAIGSSLLADRVEATADGPDHWMVREVQSPDVLNIRSKPDARSKKVGEIPHDGRCIRNIECWGGGSFEDCATVPEGKCNPLSKLKARWCRVEYKGTVGWVLNKYLIEGTCETDGF